MSSDQGETVLEQPGEKRRVARIAVTTLSGVALLASLVTTSARADQPNPVYPSAQQVAGAKAAAQSAEGQAAAIDQQLAGSRAQVDSLQQHAADAGEAANGANLALDEATAAATDAASKAAEAQSRSDEAALTLSRYAAEIYQGGGGTSQLDVFFGGGGPQDVLDRAAGVDAVGGERARMVREAESAKLLAQSLKTEAADAEARRKEAAAAAQAAAEQAKQAANNAVVQVAQLETQQQALTAQVAALRNTSVQLEQQRQSGLAAEEQRRREEANRRAAEAAAAAAAQQAAAQQAAARAAADQAAANARTARERAAAEAARQAAQNAPAPPAPPSSSGGGSSTPPPPPAPSGGVGAVIAFARAQLGEPYVWGAAGPSSWDCSGLTLMAWRQAGVSLAHYTGSQWNQTSRVPLSDLQPGDLVFYGASGPTSHHVGLYIGNGQMIHAPNPSTVVKISSIYSMSDLLPYGGRP